MRGMRLNHRTVWDRRRGYGGGHHQERLHIRVSRLASWIRWAGSYVNITPDRPIRQNLLLRSRQDLAELTDWQNLLPNSRYCAAL